MFIQLTLKESLRNILVNINNISSIVEKGNDSIICFNTEDDNILVFESIDQIKDKLENLGFFKRL